MKTIRMTYEQRREQLIKCGIKLAFKGGYHRITREALMRASGVHHSTITYYFNPFHLFRTAVLSRAIRDEITEIIGQGIINKDPLIQGLSNELKSKVIQTLMTK
jgi:AcrR family transcriptional regulator